MIFELLLFILIGCLIGTFTGLIPGIHINLVAAFIISSPIILLRFSETNLIVFIISLAITHTFLDFLPSIFLGAPNEETALSILPGHKFLLEGKGYEATILTLIGSISAIFIFILITPIIILFLPTIYSASYNLIGLILIWASIILFISNKESRIYSLIIFILAGFLGLININSAVNQPLLPLLSGLFGAPTLILAIKSKTKLPKQEIEKIKLDKKELIKPLIITSIISPICSILPGIGSSQAAVIGSKLTKEIKETQFLILLGSIGTLVMATSFITLIAIDKSRSGAANALSQLNTGSLSLGLILLSTILSATLATLIFLKVSKLFAKNITKINYSKISMVVLIFLTSLVFFISGALGLIFFLISTIIGLTCTELGVSKQFLMGSLIIPSIIFFLPF
jgi:putative membrane protein